MLIPNQTPGISRYGYRSEELPAGIAARDSIVPASRASRASLGLFGGRGLGFNCGGFGCVCTGDADCNDMFSTNVCGPYAVCIDNVCWCSR
jgi:hypothetical protein